MNDRSAHTTVLKGNKKIKKLSKGKVKENIPFCLRMTTDLTQNQANQVSTLLSGFNLIFFGYMYKGKI